LGIKANFVKLGPSPDPEFGKPCARSSHGVSVINKGTRIIVFGGEHVARTPLGEKEALWAADLDTDANTWQWRCIRPDNFPPRRVAHAQATYEDKFVYIFGGRVGVDFKEAAMNDLWKLDASGEKGTEVWTKVETKGPTPEVRSFHKMICIGESLFLFGGCGAEARLADLHRFDLSTNTWHPLGNSLLRGRGGSNVLPLASGSVLAVVAGFAGEETNDGHKFDVDKGAWEDTLMDEELVGLFPRSVCCSCSMPSVGVSILFGGEIDPSDRGHEGAGGFENDIVYLDEKSGKHLGTKPAPSGEWPETRGWADAGVFDNGDGTGFMFVFGGLSGDDANPRRLDDLWRLSLTK